jgi:hypothetical protein
MNWFLLIDPEPPAAICEKTLAIFWAGGILGLAPDMACGA